MKKFKCIKAFFKDSTFSQVFKKILPKYFRTLTERRTPFSDTCLKFMVNFLKTVIIFLGRNTPNRFLDVSNKEAITKSYGTVVEVHLS